MKYFLILLSIFFWATACQEKVKPINWGTDFSKIHLKYVQKGKVSLNTQSNENEMGIYKIWYIGNIEDTVLIPSRMDTAESDLTKMMSKYNRTSLNMESKFYVREPENIDGTLTIVNSQKLCYIDDSSDVEIFIDTMRIIGFTDKNYDFEKRALAKAYFPVFIKNISKDTLNIGSGGNESVFLRLIMEAKDKNGAWKPIEQYHVFECGNGLKEYFILPNHIAITGVKIYNGKFKTELRLTKGKIHSNSFVAYLNNEWLENNRQN